jgi:hypothetical protein
MTDLKLSDYLNAMTAHELNRLEKFAQSPFHNEDTKLTKLILLLVPAVKEGNDEEMKAEYVFKKVFGAGKFEKQKFNRLLSDATKLVENFLVLDRFNAQPTTRHTYLLEVMNERKLGKHFPEMMSFSLKKHELQPLRDSTFYYQKYQLESQHNIFLENRNLRTTEKNLQQAIYSLDVFYLINKLRYCAAILHYKNFLAIEAETTLMQEIMQHLKQNDYSHIPAINIYHKILLTLIEPEEEKNYFLLKEQIIAHQQLFPKAEVGNMMVFAMNYCINQINYGRTEYLNEVLSLYKHSLSTDLIFEEGLLSPWDYKNIITVALRVKDYKWAEGFIHQYKNKIPKKDRENAYTFNLAKYYFYVNKYDKVLQLLQDVKYDDVFYLLDSKTTLMKTYYELGELSPLHSLKDSFRLLLRRKRLINDQQRENYLNFIKLTMKLSRIDVRDTKEVGQLKTEIDKTTNVADYSWIREKIGELIPV